MKYIDNNTSQPPTLANDGIKCMLQDGQYYYAPYRRSWGVWQHKEHGNGCGSGIHYNDYPTKEEARKVVYELNGWKLK